MITIKDTKKIREKLKLTHIVIFGISEGGKQHVSTHGKTKTDAIQAAEAGNKLKAHLGWPENMCNSKPLERICGNCSFWRYDEIGRETRIPENWPGKCHLEPYIIKRHEKNIACSKFEPNK